MKHFKTSQIAKAAGVHPNTVRLYEQWGLLMPVERSENGYRLYTEAHLEQMKLARLALGCEFIAGGIREKAYGIVKLAAEGKPEQALEDARHYLSHIRAERDRAQEALALVLTPPPEFSGAGLLRRKEAAERIGVSIDVLRNWEMNGLIEVPRKNSNGYRMYGEPELRRMKIIYTLRSANYSMMAVLRMLHRMDRGLPSDFAELSGEGKDDDIRYATDRWAATLAETERDALRIIEQLEDLLRKQKASTISPELLPPCIMPPVENAGGKHMNPFEHGEILITGARENNLKNITARIPKNRLVVLTGLSGSGKSSLAYDTLQKECMRQYMESMGMVTDSMSRPSVDSIVGLSPSISVDQHITNRSPRSTVGTSTEIFTYLRILYARLGERDCPHCGSRVTPLMEHGGSVDELESGSDWDESESEEASFACPRCGGAVPELSMAHFSFNKPQGACPACTGLGVIYQADLAALVNEDICILDGAVKDWDIHYIRRNSETLQAAGKHYGFEFDISLPVKHLGDAQRELLFYGVESYQFKQRFPGVPAPETASRGRFEGIATNVLRRYAEHAEDAAYREKLERVMCKADCHMCGGTRLKEYSRRVTVAGQSIVGLSGLSLEDLLKWVDTLHAQVGPDAMAVAKPILDDLEGRIRRFVDAGVGYLSMSRGTATLSGGEAQRIRLASLLGSGLTGVLYVLDEPTTGLHSRDTGRLVALLRRLRDLGNTVLVIEHDPDMMLASDYIIDMGPGAGQEGGRIVAEGTPQELMENPHSLTGRCLLEHTAPRKESHRRAAKGWLTISGASEHNLKDVDASIPLGCLTAVTGVSGSGKSTLVFDILDKAAARRFHNAHERPGRHGSIRGLEQFSRVITVDQAPIGRVPRSNAATYTDVFTAIRNLYAGLPETEEHRLTARHFSFNVPGGRCERCEGAGVLTVNMHFLPDVTVTCPVCRGKRFEKEVLAVRYKGKSIADVLDMSIAEAYELFAGEKEVRSRLKVLVDVGMGYLKMGQPATSLSGGEAQRVKLAKELGRNGKGNTLFLLDEPTTGLHPDDVKRLTLLLQRLVDTGNTVCVVEHNLDLIAACDWVIDMGPEGGDRGGQLVAAGTPEQMLSKSGHTANALRLLS